MVANNARVCRRENIISAFHRSLGEFSCCLCLETAFGGESEVPRSHSSGVRAEILTKRMTQEYPSNDMARLRNNGLRRNRSTRKEMKELWKENVSR